MQTLIVLAVLSAWQPRVFASPQSIQIPPPPVIQRSLPTVYEINPYSPRAASRFGIAPNYPNMNIPTFGGRGTGFFGGFGGFGGGGGFGGFYIPPPGRYTPMPSPPMRPQYPMNMPCPPKKSMPEQEMPVVSAVPEPSSILMVAIATSIILVLITFKGDRMRRFKSIFAAIALYITSSAYSLAQDNLAVNLDLNLSEVVTLNYNGGSEAVYAGRTLGSLNGGPGFDVLCIDITKLINVNDSYPVFTGSATNPNEILAGKLLLVGGPMTAEDYAARQLASWDEVYNLGSGFTSGPLTANEVSPGNSLSNKILQYESLARGYGEANITRLTPTSYGQDFVAAGAVPEPASVVMMLIAAIFGVPFFLYRNWM